MSFRERMSQQITSSTIYYKIDEEKRVDEDEEKTYAIKYTITKTIAKNRKLLSLFLNRLWQIEHVVE